MTDESTVPDFGTLLDAHTLRFERDLPGPIERVWEYLTDSDLRATWLYPGEVPREVGGEYSKTWEGEDGAPGGELRLRTRIYDPPHVLEYDWIEMDAPGGAIRDSYIRFELTARGDRVHLTFTHRALPIDSYPTIGAGWHAHLDTLVAQVGGHGGPDAYARYAAIAPRYAPLGTFPAANTVRFERDLAVPVERAWAYLTEPDLLATWLARGEPATKVGKQFMLTMLANGDEIAATLTAYEPPNVIAYTWFSTHHEAPHDDHSRVRFELAPHEAGTRLVLTHTGVQPEFYGRSAAGWHSLLDALTAATLSVDVLPFSAVFPRVIGGYESLAHEKR
jgi:uncharacterized protein YndB with AHSA1/START domain